MNTIDLVEFRKHVTGPNPYPYRRAEIKKVYYAQYPDGTYFCSAGNHPQVYFQKKDALIKNLKIHVQNIMQTMVLDWRIDSENFKAAWDAFSTMMVIHETDMPIAK